MKMIVILIRTLILYAVVIVSLRIMGKRQIGELQPSELVVAIMISDLATVPMESVNSPLINGIVPVLTLILAEVIISYAGLKSRTLRKLLVGSPSVIIYDGRIVESELERMRFNLDDLLEELRLNACCDISDVEVAVLETSGKLSVIPRTGARAVTVEDVKLNGARRSGLPCTVITDGRINDYELRRSGRDMAFVMNEIQNKGAKKPKDVFIMSVNPDGDVFIQLKEKLMKGTGK